MVQGTVMIHYGVLIAFENEAQRHTKRVTVATHRLKPNLYHGCFFCKYFLSLTNIKARYNGSNQVNSKKNRLTDKMGASSLQRLR